MGSLPSFLWIDVVSFVILERYILALFFSKR